MKRLLLVDDDAFVLRSYRNRLSAHGFQVNTAESGTAALNILRGAKPDLVVLDLMMPDLSGVEVLKFIRSEKRLAATPVVVLTNAYLNDLGRQAAAVGIEKALLKAQCSPSVLMAAIDELLEHRQQPPSANSPAAPPAPPAAQPVHAPIQSPRHASAAEPDAEASLDLPADGPAVCADLRNLFHAFAREPRDAQDALLRVTQFYRKVRLLSTAAGLKKYTQLAQTATVFEALLYVIMRDAIPPTPSLLRTLAGLVDLVELVLRHASTAGPGAPPSAQILVVDDDPVSNRLVVAALRQAHLNARSTEDPQLAWHWLAREHFDLVLLDIEMPGLDGIELCKRLRLLPEHEKTPVIFVTVHSDFKTRAQSTLSGGTDLIAKPIMPMELAAKVVMQLIKRQLPAS